MRHPVGDMENAMRLARLTALLAGVMPGLAQAVQPGDLSPRPLQEGMLDDLRWQARPVVILGEGAEVEAQIGALMAEADALRARDVVILTEGPGAGPLRERSGQGFMVMLIGKDGGVKLTQSSMVDPGEIIALIDTMPMRQREARD